MSGKDYLRIWYKAQLIIALFFTVVIGAWEAYHRLPYVFLVMVLAMVLLVAVICDNIPEIPDWLALVNRWLQAFGQPVTFIILWGGYYPGNNCPPADVPAGRGGHHDVLLRRDARALRWHYRGPV